MQRTFGRLACLTVFLLYVPACGQSEGGRCQVNSDCGSGLTCCQGSTGNGICRTSCFSADASAGLPGTKEDAPSSSLDSGSDLVLMSSVDGTIDEASAGDTAEIEAGGVD